MISTTTTRKTRTPATTSAPAALSLLLLSGCASHYYQPPPGPTAQLRFKAWGTYAHIDPERSCKSRWRLDVPVAKDKERVVSIQAGATVRIEEGTTMDTAFSGGHCTVAASFLPEAGAVYETEYATDYRRCRLRIWRLDPDGARMPEPSAKPDTPIHCEFSL
ncbi:hypothetical protein [Methylibium sp.]|jgi:hypothetical protein|uniref:hypothetical protein n=1 Tax=Methylibium sp. TaxID=2067992 RepID=UPI003F6FD9F7